MFAFKGIRQLGQLDFVFFLPSISHIRLKYILIQTISGNDTTSVVMMPNFVRTKPEFLIYRRGSIKPNVEIRTNLERSKI